MGTENQYKSEQLKKGSILSVTMFSFENGKQSTVKVDCKVKRVSKFFVWFEKNGYERLGHNTINRNQDYYTIKSL